MMVLMEMVLLQMREEDEAEWAAGSLSPSSASTSGDSGLASPSSDCDSEGRPQASLDAALSRKLAFAPARRHWEAAKRALLLLPGETGESHVDCSIVNSSCSCPILRLQWKGRRRSCGGC